MENLQLILKVLRKYEGLIHESEYSQFTIDFIQNNEMDVDAIIDDGDQTVSYIEDVIKAFQYDVSCILEIVKEGKDKELFESLEKDIESL